jgi:ADP-ribose pyrophosphatase YjhB (NUDIX family)
MIPISKRHKIIPAVYVLFQEDEKILLVRRANTGYHDGDYTLPSGHVESRESAVAAAAREAKEEVGVDIGMKDLQLIHTLHRYSEDPKPHERIDLYFKAGKWKGQPHNAEPSKCDEVLWVDIDKLPENMVPELKASLPKIFSGQPYSDMNFA